MAKCIDPISALIPMDLQDADERLHRYGRWAADRPSQRRCGSAERAYIPSRGESFEARREPRQVLMDTDDAMRCQRALARVPDRERVVLAVLYVPRRIPAETQLRMLRVPPRLAAERHLVGLRMFDNIWRCLASGISATRVVGVRSA